MKDHETTGKTIPYSGLTAPETDVKPCGDTEPHLRHMHPVEIVVGVSQSVMYFLCKGVKPTEEKAKLADQIESGLRKMKADA